MRGKGRCKCPYEASVYSKRDGKKIRKTFPTMTRRKAWRDDARTAVRKQLCGRRRHDDRSRPRRSGSTAPAEGVIRNRSGDPYKPSAIRAYEQALRLRVLPELGAMRSREVTRTDLQDLVDRLVAAD